MSEASTVVGVLLSIISLVKVVLQLKRRVAVVLNERNEQREVDRTPFSFVETE